MTKLAFNELKKALTTAHVLHLSDFIYHFTLETDAFGVGMGTVLSQKGHLITFFSKPFTPELLQASTYVRELFAITAAIKKWQQYLLGHHFTILTNHRSLKEIMTQVIQTLEQQTYLARLIGYDYYIQYCSGKLNGTADALSRVLEFISNKLLLLSVACLTFLNELKHRLLQNTHFLQLQQEIMNQPE